MEKQLPNYVLSKKYDYFLFFYSDFILSEKDNILKTTFLNFLKRIQANTKIVISNSNCSEPTLVDYANYNSLLEKYWKEKPENLGLITESPDISIFSPSQNWEIYSNTVFNLSILAHNIELKEIVIELFISSGIPYIYKDKYDYVEKSRFIFKDNDIFVREFIKNY